MARLSICSGCDGVVWEDPDGPDYVMLDEDDHNLMHAKCYEGMITRDHLNELDDLLGEQKKANTEVAAKKRRRMPPDKAA